jgi:hypothetical protein
MVPGLRISLRAQLRPGRAAQAKEKRKQEDPAERLGVCDTSAPSTQQQAQDQDAKVGACSRVRRGIMLLVARKGPDTARLKRGVNRGLPAILPASD